MFPKFNSFSDFFWWIVGWLIVIAVLVWFIEFSSLFLRPELPSEILRKLLQSFFSSLSPFHNTALPPLCGVCRILPFSPKVYFSLFFLPYLFFFGKLRAWFLRYVILLFIFALFLPQPRTLPKLADEKAKLLSVAEASYFIVFIL